MGQILLWSMLGVMGRNNRIRDVSHKNRVLRITLRFSGLCGKEILLLSQLFYHAWKFSFYFVVCL